MANSTSPTFIGALDQGTTSTRFIIFDENGSPVCSHQLEHNTYRPHPGWEEHDPIEIVNNVKKCIDACLETAEREHSITPRQVVALGITNQRETTVVWDRYSGIPLHNAIVWQDIRTQSTCDVLRKKHDSERIREKCGLPISTYFSGVKLRWLLDNVEVVRNAVDNGSALFGTIDTWLVWNLSKERVHVTDVTNAGRTMLMNIDTLAWDDSLLSMLEIPRAILPEIKSSSEYYGILAGTRMSGTPITGLIGDQQAALVGQGCFGIGEAKNTYGTGCFLIVNTGTEPKRSKNQLLTTPGYQMGPNAPCVYSLEGSVAVAGSAVTWLRDGLEVITSSSETENLAKSVNDTGDVYVVPAFTGLFAPWWREDARGIIIGITQYTTKAHIVRAVLESMAYTVDSVLQAAAEDMGAPISELKVDGGVTSNALVMQMQSDITGTAVVKPKVIETTALGAAFAAGHAVGYFQSEEHFRESWKLDRRFEPQINAEERRRKIDRFNMAVERSLGWSVSDRDGTDEGVVTFGTKAVPFLNKRQAGLTMSKDMAIGMVTGIAIATVVLLGISRCQK